MWHAGATRVGLQACAAHVWQRVRECDFMKDSFAWCVRATHPPSLTGINTERGTCADFCDSEGSGFLHRSNNNNGNNKKRKQIQNKRSLVDKQQQWLFPSVCVNGARSGESNTRGHCWPPVTLTKFITTYGFQKIPSPICPVQRGTTFRCKYL